MLEQNRGEEGEGCQFELIGELFSRKRVCSELQALSVVWEGLESLLLHNHRVVLKYLFCWLLLCWDGFVHAIYHWAPYPAPLQHFLIRHPLRVFSDTPEKMFFDISLSVQSTTVNPA